MKNSLLIDEYGYAAVKDVDGFLTRQVYNYRSGGWSWAEINNDLDRRILLCGQVFFMDYSKNYNDFKLSKLKYTSLYYSYGIFAANKHLPRHNEIDINLYNETEKEWKRWTIEFSGTSKMKLCCCVLALNKFAEIQESGLPFVVK